MNTDLSLDDIDIWDWVSSKIYYRGEEYFRAGAVLSAEVDENDTLCAEVEGTDIYTVKVGVEDSELWSECTCPYDWEPVCKHAVAAVLHWQNDGRDAPVDAREEAEESPRPEAFDRKRHIREIAEIEKRRRRTQKSLGSIKIKARPKKGLAGEYLVSSELVNKNYSVLVRDAANLDRTTCTCHDYLVNELGTCKHIELVKRSVDKTSKRGVRGANKDIWLSIAPRETGEGPVHPFEEIHFHAGDEKVMNALRAAHTKYWGADGYLCNTENGTGYKQKLNFAIKGLQRYGRVVVAGHVQDLAGRLDAEAAWHARLDKIIASPSSSREWTECKNGLNIKLYDYQQEGTLFAVRNRRSFIGDDMGLGKTVQAIAAACFIKKLAGIGKVVVIAPASLKHQWKKEIEKIAGEGVQIVSGTKQARREIYETSGAAFLIMNYELIYRDWDLLQEMKPCMVILDEAQRIKNWETKTAKWLKRLSSEFALALTGTPFENRLLELHSLCEFLRPRALGPMWRLVPAHAELDRNDKLIGYSNLSRVRSNLADFFIRRERSVVASQLPEKVVNEYLSELTPEQRSYHDDYQDSLARILSVLKKRPLTPEEVKRVFMCLTGMRMAGNAFALLEWKRYEKTVGSGAGLSMAQIRGLHSPKLLEFRSVMEELLEPRDTKFVIFSQWERMLKLADVSIKDIVVKNGAESAIFSGSLSLVKRAETLRRFNDDPMLRVLFSTDAGGVGLNLQEAASTVMNLEMPWNPAVLEQRIARVHRPGQKRTVNVVNFISTECIEEKVYDAICNKKALFDGVFNGMTDKVIFDKGSSFIDRLKGMIDEDEQTAGSADVQADGPAAETADAASREETAKGPENAGTRASAEQSPASSGVSVPVPSAGNGRADGGPGGPETYRTIDLSGILKALGTWVGRPEIASLGDGQLKLKVKEEDGEIKLSLAKPPKELLTGIKNAFLEIFA